MKPVYLLSDNMISSLGFSTKAHWEAVLRNETGLKIHKNPAVFKGKFCGSLVDFSDAQVSDTFEVSDTLNDFTRLEKLFILSIKNALSKTDISVNSNKTVLIFSTTKGNIDQINKNQTRLNLGKMSEKIAKYFRTPNQPITVSNACISGTYAIILAIRLLRSGKFENAVLSGGDIVSDFTLSGFKSLTALCDEPCRPFDKNRKGINLGEGCGTMILSVNKSENSNIQILKGAVSNDANHISGPSRTGEGLQIAVRKALKNSGVSAEEIDYISAHGTATIFNDEMESKAFSALQMSDIPLNSFKGYWGHTLGAAGILEAVLGIQSLKNDFLIASKGYAENGVTERINVIEKNGAKGLKTFLKTSSGFGGCNAAVVISKEKM